MTKGLHFDGIIRNVTYDPQLITDLPTWDFSDFEINTATPEGIIKLPNKWWAYSKWDSPLQTKYYPFGRIYNTYEAVNGRITIIPILFDSGANGRLEYIQYSTLSWMNLANVYIVFTFVENAVRSSKNNQHKLIKQKLNNEVIKSQIEKLIPYHSSALHWNRNQFENELIPIYEKAIYAYEKISKSTKVSVHSRKLKLNYLDKIRRDCRKYEGISIGVKSTTSGKDRKLHENKYEEGDSSVFYLIDELGGIYYLTAKDVWQVRDTYIIQETRYAGKGFFPPLSRIRDGLFRLIFFGNIDILYRNGRQVRFQPRLTLLGEKVKGTLYFPCKDNEFNAFLKKNRKSLSQNEIDVLNTLRLEVEKNQCFAVEIGRKL